MAFWNPFRRRAPRAAAGAAAFPLAELTGFFLAHAVWCVSDDPPLVPFAAFDGGEGKRDLNRFESERYEEAVAAAQAAVARGGAGIERAVAVYDGYYTGADGVRRDALIAEAREYASGRTLTVALPYRRPDAPGGFAVHKPKLLEITGEAAEAFGDSLFQGIDAHEKGAQVWNAHLDQSV